MQAIKRFFQETWYPVTLGLFLFPVICLLLGTFGFLVGIPITKWHAPIGFILSIVSATYLCKSWRARVVVTGLISVILGTLLVVSSLTLAFEIEFDGFGYHKPAMIGLKEGWNPYWDPNPWSQDIKDGKVPLIQVGPWCRWVEYFPKATYIVGAQLYATTGNVDQIHGINVLFVFVLVPICFVAIRTIFCLSIFKSLLFSLILAGNPTILGQISTGYVDGILGACLTILFFSLASYFVDKNSRWLPFIVGSILIATNAKFTGVVYVGLFLLIVLVGQLGMDLWYKRCFDRKILTVLGVATILALIVGINPYLQNLYKHHHPFYPLAVTKKTDKKEDIMANFVNKQNDFKTASRLQRFVFSHITPPNEKWPVSTDFTIKPNQLLIGKVSGREAYNGFGAVFAVPLVFSLLMLPMIRKGNIWILIIAVWATVLINPHNWWARYVPQLWIIPVIVLCALSAQSSVCSSLKRRFNLIVYFMAFLFLLSSYYSLVGITGWSKADRNSTVRLICLNERFPGQLHLARQNDPLLHLYHEVAVFREMSPGILLDGVHDNLRPMGNYGNRSCFRMSYIPSESETLNQVLVNYPSATLLVSVKDGATGRLSEETKQIFRNAGGNIDQLKFHGAYIAVFQRGKIVTEKIDDAACELEFNDSQTGQAFRLASAGYKTGNYSSIRIGHKEYSPNRRGLNIVVVEENAYPLGYSFDTRVDPNPPGIPHMVLRNHQVINELLKLRLRQLHNVWIPTACLQ